MAASVRGRLLHLAREGGGDFQRLLLRYANERWLYRLALSEHAQGFVLKGAALFTLWTGAPHRATRDVDLLGFGEASVDRIRRIVSDVMAMPVPQDGIVFDRESLTVLPIREEQVYGGLRAQFRARLGTARVNVQVDVGFGDAITPEVPWTELPVLLDLPAPRLQTYPRETVVAEKLEALVQLGLGNSRMKDFYDLAVLARSFEFDGTLLVRAIRGTFERRGTPLPRGLPPGLTPEFAADGLKLEQWTAFLRKSEVPERSELADVVGSVARFVGEPLAVAAAGGPWSAFWPADGPWRRGSES